MLSRRAVLEEERKEVREQILERLQPGQIVEGKISNIVDFGAFVDLEGIDGLIHISELSWSHVNHPSEVLEIGQDVRVKVLDIDRDRQRISLGLKQTQEDPWQKVLNEYRPGDVLEGKVTKVVAFGAFIEIVPGVEGLVHISELAEHHVETPGEVVTPGEEKWVRILEIDEERRRISLSIKRAETENNAFSDLIPDELKQQAQQAASDEPRPPRPQTPTEPAVPEPRAAEAFPDAADRGARRRGPRPGPLRGRRRGSAGRARARRGARPTDEGYGRRRDGAQPAFIGSDRGDRVRQVRGAGRAGAPRRRDALDRRGRPRAARRAGDARAGWSSAGAPTSRDSGHVDRAGSARSSSTDPDELRWLESIAAPDGGREGRELARAARTPGTELAVVEVPLLFEAGMEAFFDATLVVVAGDERRERWAGERGDAGVEGRSGRQLTEDEKAARATCVVENDGDARGPRGGARRALATSSSQQGSRR